MTTYDERVHVTFCARDPCACVCARAATCVLCVSEEEKGRGEEVGEVLGGNVRWDGSVR